MSGGRRSYAALYHRRAQRWSIIARDEADAYWFIYQEDAGDEQTAEHVARALNAEAAS